MFSKHSRHLRRCSTFLVREIQVRTTVRLSPHTYQNGYQEKATNTNVNKGVEKRDPLYTAGEDANWCSHVGKSRGSSKKLRVQPQDSTIPLLGLYPKKMKTPNQEDSHTPMFIKASFTIVKTRKQAKWPLTEELMKKLGQTDRHTYTQTYDGKIFSHKKNEILPAVTTQRPRRYYATRNKADRNKYSMISVIFGI